jgi:ribose transport system permease protein
MSMITKTMKKIPILMWGAIIIILVFAITSPKFAQVRNIDNILKNSSILIIVGMGMTMAIISGQIDLSIGGVMSAAGMIGAIYIKQFKQPTVWNIIVTVLIGMAIGLAFGLFNGIMIGKFKFNYWLITFSTLSIGYGVAKVVTNGNILAGYSKNFRFLAGGSIGGVSTSIIIAAIVVVIMGLVIRRTRFGFHIYAVGDSEQCSLQSGIYVDKTRMLIYTLSGLLAGFAGILLMSKTNSAAPISGEGYEFNAIAAVVVGGTTFEGGKGGIFGTILGALIIAAIKSGLQIIGLSTYMQQTLIGLFILSIIVVDVITSNRRKISALRRLYKND